jgi:hypothetical protein
VLAVAIPAYQPSGALTSSRCGSHPAVQFVSLPTAPSHRSGSPPSGCCCRNMTDDHGVENEDDVKKKDLDLLNQKGHWDQFHHENTRCVRRAVWPLAPSFRLSIHLLLFFARRPSYHEPRSPVGDSTVEVGVAYSQEEEMAGRLHAELEKMKREGSTAQLTASAA